ncbi:SNF2 family N-terminal domain-containing protein [Lineolata rhizophorae]|uniref:SNF2 family N-terminal domain-containing protein n=1 Tax=Lineolata rhizophorae TaxID=578093 RepID=A0A6A6NMJ1_9PEZI|nr:SNF2 family N-terminal domain-containing protein [Lineolata rhizophorae]
MVKERDTSRPGKASPAPKLKEPWALVQQAPPQQQQPLQPAPNSTINHTRRSNGAAAPEFGKPSPLRNPSKDKYAHLFNMPKPGQPRPEHHQPPAESRQPGFGTSKAARPNNASANDDSVVEISRPQAAPSWTTHPAQRPMFSSATASASTSASGFQPVNIPGYKPVGGGSANAGGWQSVNRPTPMNFGTTASYVDFTGPSKKAAKPEPESDISDAESNASFNADAGVVADAKRFGAADAMEFVDQGKANENIKALLEGAFGEEEEGAEKIKLRRVLRKRAKNEGEAKGLVDKLKALEVENKSDQKEDAKEEEDEEDDDDGTVDGLAVRLFPHQIDGVAWMTDKEVGARKRNGVLPKGGILADDMGLGKTIQSITLILTNPRPSKEEAKKQRSAARKIPDKVGHSTLIVAPLALIKQWESEIKEKVEKSHALKVRVHHGPSRTKRGAELAKYDIVITTYNTLASEHANGEGAEVGTGLFGVHWYRIILDEAHSIKNRSAKMTKAAYALKSWYRWCLTGTPMQNNLDELQSLVRFLRIRPYCDMSAWKAQISGPMKNGKGNLAMKRLQYFLKAFMKRRLKDVLKQPGADPSGNTSKGSKGGPKGPTLKVVERKVEDVEVDFSPSERVFYDRFAARANESLNQMMGSAKTDYIGALVLLLRLRQACNHRNLLRGHVDEEEGDTLGGVGEKQSRGGDADDVLAGMMGGLTVGTERCEVCEKQLNPSEKSAGQERCAACEEVISAKSEPQPKKGKKSEAKKRQNQKKTANRSRRVVLDNDDEEEDNGEWLVLKGQCEDDDLGVAGGTDDEDAEGGGESLGSDDSEQGDGEDDEDESEEEDSESESDDDSSSSEPTSRPAAKMFEIKAPAFGADPSDPCADGSSAKVRALLSILRRETPGHKVIVFSQFTSMLDAVEPFLQNEGLAYCRYDGSMRNDAREESLRKLREVQKVRVMLCSLKCGSLGLNLTAASRVVILEPFWNPFVEEQAIDRVHRLNQTTDVHIYKLTVRETVEARIVELQEAKRKLAKAAIEGAAQAAKLSMQDILRLFRGDADVGPEVGAPGQGMASYFTQPPKGSVLHGATAVQGQGQGQQHMQQQRTGVPGAMGGGGAYGLGMPAPAPASSRTTYVGGGTLAPARQSTDADGRQIVDKRKEKMADSVWGRRW